MAKKYIKKKHFGSAGTNRSGGFDYKKIAIAVGSAVSLLVLFFAVKALIGSGGDGSDNVVHVVFTSTTTGETASDTAETVSTGDVAALSATTETDTAASTGSEAPTETSESASSTDAATTESASTTETPETDASDAQGFYSDIKITDTSYGILLLCNKSYRLPDDFDAADLQDVSDNYYVHDGKEYKMNKEALEAFMAMSDAAYSENSNIDLRIVSGYRTKSYQEFLYNSYVNSYGKSEADTYSARPRHSEHETGLCCDINIVSESFKNTEAYAWLVENAADYGFILRFPEGKEHITGYIYEPWHWRYVGSETAKAVVASGLTYDEYFLQYIGE